MLCINYLQHFRNGLSRQFAFLLLPLSHISEFIFHISYYCKTFSFLHKLRYIIVSVEGFAHLWKLYKSWGSFLIWITYICMHIVCWYMFVYILTLVFVLFVSEFVLLLLLLLLLLCLACLFASNSCIIFWPPFPASTCADSAALYRSSYRRPVWSAVNELKSIRDKYRLSRSIFIYIYVCIYNLVFPSQIIFLANLGLVALLLFHNKLGIRSALNVVESV